MLAIFCVLGILAAQEDEPPDMPEEEWTGPPAATLHSASFAHGKHQFEEGVWLRFDFQLDGCRDEDCTLGVRFFDENEKPLEDRNGEHSDGKGHVAVRTRFQPVFVRARYSRETLFLPTNEFHLAAGNHTIYYEVEILRKDDAGKSHVLLTSDRKKLPLKIKSVESGELAKLRPETNVKEGSERGLRVTVDACLRGMKGRKARLALEVYYGLSNVSPLYPVYHHGQETEGVVRVTQELSPDDDVSVFAGRTLWVPNSTFPLKVGRNRFFFKVWLQAEGDPWVPLDSTTAKQFFVDNGSLKLKEVWVIEKKEVLLDWEPTPEDRAVLTYCLTEFNRRLYDATDGQVRIRSFVVGRMTKHPEHCNDPVLRVYRDFKKGDHGKINENRKRFIDQMRSFAHLGRPDKPGDAHLVYEQMLKKPSHFPGVLTHEFIHATFGIGDEYTEDKSDPKKSNCQPFCAKDEVLRQAWGTCIMASSNAILRELCSPETHSDGNSKRPRKDCYTVVQERLKKAFDKTIVVPDTPVEGPTNPPQPTFAWE